MGIVQSLKNVYGFFENGYYAILDKIDKAIPIYRIVDPIDRVFPSFVIVLLLLLSVAGFVWFGGLEKPSATATFQFFGKDNAAISGLTAKFHYGDTGLSKTTDSEGKIFLDVPLDSNLTVSVNKAGFQPFTQSFRISASETHSIQLSAVEVLKKTMVFLDAQNRPLSNKTIQLSYSCSQQSSAAPGNQSISLPELTVDVPQGCGMLTATARVGDSEPQSKPLVSPRTVFIFGAAAPVSSATIEISVKDNQNHALAGIDLKLYDASNNRLVNQTRSDASGTAEFEAIPGRYSVRAIDDSGSFASQTSSTISLNENDSKTVSFTLQPVPSNNRRKLLLKIVDTNSNAAVSGANVRLLLNATEFASLNSSASGIAEKLVSETDQNNYVAIVTHANFLLNVSVGIRPISESDSNARVIALTPKTASNASSIAATILDDQNRAVQGAKVLLQSATIVGLNLSEKVTGNDGNALFENLPAGQYVVKAVLVRNNSETKGTSPTIPLIGGQNEPISGLMILLVPGKNCWKPSRTPPEKAMACRSKWTNSHTFPLKKRVSCAIPRSRSRSLPTPTQKRCRFRSLQQIPLALSTCNCWMFWSLPESGRICCSPESNTCSTFG